jgi:hypothetical protein
MTDDPLSDSPTFADWRKLPPIEQAKAWEKIRPGTFAEIWKEAVTEGQHRRGVEGEESRHRQKMEIEEARHRRRMDWFVQGMQAFRILGALAALFALSYVGIYFVDHHAPTQGASIFGVGGVTLVGLFLGSNPNLIGVVAKAKRSSRPTAEDIHIA